MSEPNTPKSPSRDERIGRILNDFHDRRARGEPVSQEELLAAHPDLADDLRPYLEMLGDLRSEGDRIKRLVADGVLRESDDPAYQATLGEYKTVGFLGRGGMGIVLKAHEESLNRTVALKILRPELADDKASLQRFTREAKAAAMLRHPNIVTVHAVGELHGVNYIAMEYIEGPTLADVIHEQAPLPTETIRRLFRDVLLGLAAAHKAGLVHRDIKPANILIDGWAVKPPGASGTDKPIRAGFCEAGAAREAGDVNEAGDAGTPAGGTGPTRPGSVSSASTIEVQSSIVNLQSSILKIADFGLARMAVSETRITLPNSTPGTPEYMSPEQARGDEDIDHRADLYSAGVVLYEMLTGRTPFRADTPSAVIHRILHDEPADPRTISEEADPHLASLALRLMAKRPEDRFASAAEAIEALEAGQHVESREKRRRSRRRILTALIALGLIVGAGWLTQRLVAGGGKITDVRIDPDTRLSIQARYGDDPKWRRFYTFASEAQEISDVVRADLDGKGRLAIVASIAKPLDSGDSLFAFDAEGHPTWSMNLSSRRKWPDCKPSTQWMSGSLATADVDNEPGDEIIVVAKDSFEYPTRVSITNPRTGEIKASFWHFGQISNMWVVPDFFGSGQPAIIAHGKNNKLDGFYEPRPDDPEKLTDWDTVSVMMILDPREMISQRDGLGPPHNDCVDIPPAKLHAYAFVGLPPSEEEDGVSPGGGQATEPSTREHPHISLVLDAPFGPGDDTNPWFSVFIEQPDVPGSATLIVDRNLALRQTRLADKELTRTTEADWRKYWHLITQNGAYVDD